MSSTEVNEKSAPITNILTITRPSPTRTYTDRENILSTIEDVDSTHSLTPTTETYPKSALASSASTREESPFSPFYEHTPSRSHLEATSRTSLALAETKNQLNVYETDLEAANGFNTSQTNVLSPYSSSLNKGSLLNQTKSGKPCTVWPGRQQLKEKKDQMRLAKGWHPLARFDKRTRIIIKVLLGLLLIGIVTGVGVGITKAVGGGVWRNETNPSSHS